MKELHIVTIAGVFPALPETFILNPITRLIDLGHDVRVISLSPSKGGKVQEDVLSYNLFSKIQYPVRLSKSKWLQRLKTSVLWGILFLKRPISALKVLKANLRCQPAFSHKRLLFSIQLFRRPFDLVHCHFGPNAFDVVELKKAGLDIPLVTSFHGYDINRYPLSAGKDCYKDLFSVGELFTANTEYTRQRIIEHDCDPSRIHIVHESLRCDKFRFDIKNPPSPGNLIKILTVGRLVEKKGYEYSLQAIAKVLSKGHPVEYWAVGDGPLREELEELIRELNIASHIKLLGALTESEVLKLYQKADLFMLPSVTASDGDKEGQGLVLQEAQMAGLPVISTLHNGIPDGVLDNRSGFLVPERDINALAEKIEYLIQHPEIWKSFGETGQAFVQKTFDVSCVIDSLLKVYQKLILKK